MQNFTLHTHTVGFDGRNTPREMVARAAECGMHTIGVSNHFIVHPRIKESKMYAAACAKGHAWSDIYASSFDEVMARFIPHYAEMEQIADAAGIRVLRGMEVDWFNDDAWRRDFDAAVRVLRPDYLIGAKHFVELDGVLYNPHDMEHAAPELQDRLLAAYWDNIARAAHSGLFNWMAHLDLPKKVGLGRDEKWVAHENAALDAIADAHIAIEVNASGIARMSEPYPSARILCGVVARKIPVILSDDAHRTEQIGYNFDVAGAFARDAGVTNFATVDQILNIH